MNAKNCGSSYEGIVLAIRINEVYLHVSTLISETLNENASCRILLIVWYHLYKIVQSHIQMISLSIYGYIYIHIVTSKYKNMNGKDSY